MTLIEGDGIGPEISQSVKDIFAAAKVYIASRAISHQLIILGTHYMGAGRCYTGT